MVPVNKVDLSSLGDAECIKLVTFRKSGAEVGTPVWFVLAGSGIFVRTLAHFGKVRRLRNDPSVRFAACDWHGNLRGPWYRGEAELLSPDDVRIGRIDGRFDAKYGERRAEMNRLIASEGFVPVFIGITPFDRVE